MESHLIADKPGKLFYYDCTVRISHMDTLGHMNHTAYMVLFEEARWQMGKETGYGYEQIREWKKCPAVFEMNVRFHNEVLLDDKVRISTRYLEYRKKIARVEQIAYRPDGKKAATALLTYAILDLVTRKLEAPTREWFKALGLENVNA